MSNEHIFGKFSCGFIEPFDKYGFYLYVCANSERNAIFIGAHVGQAAKWENKYGILD